jgi:hypothetical protein
MTPTTDQLVQDLVDALQTALVSLQAMRRHLRDLDCEDGAMATAGLQRALTALSSLRERGFGRVSE